MRSRSSVKIRKGVYRKGTLPERYESPDKSDVEDVKGRLASYLTLQRPGNLAAAAGPVPGRFQGKRG